MKDRDLTGERVSRNTTVGDLQEAISAAVKQYVASAATQAIEDAKRELDAKIPEIVAAVAISVQSFLEAHDNAAVIQIRVSPGALRNR